VSADFSPVADYSFGVAVISFFDTVDVVCGLDAGAGLVDELAAEVSRVREQTDACSADAKIERARPLPLRAERGHTARDDGRNEIQVAVRHQHVARLAFDVDFLAGDQAGTAAATAPPAANTIAF